MKVLIVDDERRTRETLRDAVPWKDVGIAEVKLARNGLEAMEIAGKWLPEIVLTDVRMPKMDGIELAKELRAANIPCRILFLSAYTDVDYLKNAIRLRAEDYLEKPVDPRAVLAAASAAIASIAAERRSATPRERILESMVLDAADGRMDRATLEERYRSANDAAFASILRPIVLRTVWVRDVPESERVAALRALAARVNGAPPLSPSIIAAASVGETTLLAIAADGDDRAERTANVLLDAAEQSRPFDLRVSCGIGPAVDGDSSWMRAFSLAERAVGLAFYGDDRVVALGTDVLSVPVRPAPIAALANFLAGGNSAAALDLLRDEAAADRETSSDDLCSLRRKWADILRVIADRSGGLSALEAEREAAAALVHADSAPTFSDLVSYATERLTALYRPDSGSASREKIAAAVKSVIRSRYMDDDLSVESTARDVGLSVAYLCTVFKRASGMTVKDYIDSVRIEAAKAALRSSNDKLAAVAERVGFRDPNHFSAFFKARTGLTPREFRLRMGP